MSIIVVCAAVLLHTPVLDPLAISASNQFSRLQNGKVDPEKFDYAKMRFSYGRVGYEKLKELEYSIGGADAKIIRDKVVATLRLKNAWDKLEAKPIDFKGEDLIVIPSKSALPKGLFDFVRHEINEYEREACVKRKDCTLIAANMDSDPADEYLFIVSNHYNNVMLIDRSASGWQVAGNYTIVADDKGNIINTAALINEFKRGGLKTIHSEYRDVRAGKLKLLYTGSAGYVD